MSPREKATAELLYFIGRFAPGSKNREIYEDRLSKMSDAQFKQFMSSLESGEEVLALFIPPMSDSNNGIDLERNFDIAKELDYDLLQHVYLTDPDTGQVYRSESKHLILDLPLRRQAQMLYKKMSIAENNQAVDERSGQRASSSKGASMSYPEIQVNAGKGLNNMIIEAIKFRGGDVKAFNAMNRSILDTGEADLDEIQARGKTTVKANQTLGVFLRCMMLENTL